MTQEEPSSRSFSSEHDPMVSERVVWAPGELEFTVETYLTDDFPPDSLITSVRCVVLHDDCVLVLTDADGIPHIVPGGRCESGETQDATVRRELREETNLHVGALNRLGFLHFRHQLPKPTGYTYPYPDFVQVVFGTVAASGQTIVCNDEWVVNAAFRPIEETAPGLPESQRLLLDRAIKATRSTPR